ncbi:hypothetical protein MASR1M31_17020 [Porphyromonadaceae bacterium]
MRTSIFFSFILLISGYTQICYAENKSNDNAKIITKGIAIGSSNKIRMNIPVGIIIIQNSEYRLTSPETKIFLL